MVSNETKVSKKDIFQIIDCKHIDSIPHVIIFQPLQFRVNWEARSNPTWCTLCKAKIDYFSHNHVCEIVFGIVSNTIYMHFLS